MCEWKICVFLPVFQYFLIKSVMNIRTMKKRTFVYWTKVCFFNDIRSLRSRVIYLSVWYLLRRWYTLRVFGNGYHIILAKRVYRAALAVYHIASAIYHYCVFLSVQVHITIFLLPLYRKSTCFGRCFFNVICIGICIAYNLFSLFWCIFRNFSYSLRISVAIFRNLV